MISIDSIVESKLCTGCGACISEDISQTASMQWDENGFLTPKTTSKSTQQLMVEVCPFKPNQINEDELSKEFIESLETTYHSKIGNYRNLYAGYSTEYRNTSSSGGLATYVFGQLIRLDLVEHLFVVIESEGSYAYKLISDIDELKSISKTRYVPVTLEELFVRIQSIEGRIAVSGTACFVKSIRLKQLKNPELKYKIPFIVGIICGGLKSKFYSDFLAQSAECFDPYYNAQYRVKNIKSTATDYKFACTNAIDNRIHMVDMQKLGDMWGSGLFKANACDFCDDVLTELADISLGDAWIQPYSSDGSGSNIVITRSALADRIITEGIKSKDLILDRLSESDVLLSQSGSFNHRHKGLKYRVDHKKSRGIIVPKKRKRFLKDQNFIFNKVQALRMQTREKSLIVWRDYPNVIDFNSRMNNTLAQLKKITKINKYVQKMNLTNLKKTIKSKLNIFR